MNDPGVPSGERIILAYEGDPVLRANVNTIALVVFLVMTPMFLAVSSLMTLLFDWVDGTAPAASTLSVRKVIVDGTFWSAIMFIVIYASNHRKRWRLTETSLVMTDGSARQEVVAWRDVTDVTARRFGVSVKTPGRRYTLFGITAARAASVRAEWINAR